MASIAKPITTPELIQLCAADDLLFCKTFFPQTFRQDSPPFHQDIFDLLQDRSYRYVAAEVFRGGGKTSLLRAFVGKRIAYAASRFILFVSKSEDHARQSMAWLREEMETNHFFAATFGLKQGKKWNDECLEIWHGVEQCTISVQPLGITGQTRGMNVKSWRPDLIVCDDPNDEENSATPEQRQKMNRRFFGALARSLTAETENPDAKMVLLQTGLNQEDLINTCHADPQWASRKYSCFDNRGESSWPQRFPTAWLVAEKQAYMDRGQLSIWLSEMECKIVSDELAAFRQDWMKLFDVPPGRMPCFLAIDPVPPKKENEVLERHDWEVLSVVGTLGGSFYLLDGVASRGHDPEWTVNKFFDLLAKWHPVKARVEGVQYQKTLAWLLEKEMGQRRQYCHINSEPDRRGKRHRIVQAFSGVGSQGRFFVRRDLADFQTQFVAYPSVMHDDWLDSVAMALEEAMKFEGVGGMEYDPEGQFATMPTMEWRACP